MRFERPVREALDATASLQRLLEADFDVDLGGFLWWHNYNLSDVVITGIADYLYGLTVAVADNLQSAAVHLADHDEIRGEADAALLQHLKEASSLNGFFNEVSSRRDAQVHAHETGVLRACGSILDALAGVVVGVGGFEASILRADLGYLQPFADGPDYPGPDVRGKLKITASSLDPDDVQGALLRATRSSLRHAGPDGWLEWTQFSRNDRVHRASRLKMNLVVAADKVAKPLPRQPDFAETLGFRSARGVSSLLLTEDSQTTLAGVVGSVNVAILGTFMACEQAWTTRRANPALVPQPAGQWPTSKSPRSTTFKGYAPGSVVLPSDSTALVLNPETVRRLRAAKVFDGDHPTTP
ncbi:hypothetical protein [Lentzea sp. NPDC060358]|uniref:hypothetical protein n=1 Tax=Lentzea sp. NPDC060358 TaxID=3347103 RepID=UPI00365CC6AA